VNHHSFRMLVQRLPASVIKLANINPAHFKAVCFVLSMYGDYESGTQVRPSWLTVAREAGVDRKTAMKVRDYLLSKSILIPVSKTEANISVYEFNQLSNIDSELSIIYDQMSNSKNQLSNIDGHNTTIDTTKDTTYNNNYKARKRNVSSWPSTLEEELVW